MEQVQDYHRWLMYGHSSIWELRSIWYVNVCAVIEAIEVLVTHIDFAIQKTQNINQIPSTKSLKYLTNDENGYSDINLLLSLLESFSEKKKKNCLNKPSSERWRSASLLLLTGKILMGLIGVIRGCATTVITATNEEMRLFQSYLINVNEHTTMASFP